MKKIVVIAVCIALAATLVAGCSSTAATSGSAAAASPAAAATSAAAAPASAAAADTSSASAEPSASNPYTDPPSNSVAYTIGLSQEGLDHSYMITQRAQILAAVADYNKQNPTAQIKLICTDGQNKVEQQANGIMDMLAQGINVLMIEASDGEGLKQALKQAETKKVPYMFVGKPMNGTNAVTMVNNDNLTIGEQAGKWAVDYLTKKNGSPKGNIAIIRGISGDQSAEDRNNGFLNITKADSDIKVLCDIDGGYRRDKSFNVMQDILQANPKGTIDLLYGASGETGIGAALATNQAGRKGEFPIISIDGDKESISNIKSGDMTAAWTYEPCGTQGFETALKILKGEKVDAQIIVPSRQIDSSNADSSTPAF